MLGRNVCFEEYQGSWKAAPVQSGSVELQRGRPGPGLGSTLEPRAHFCSPLGLVRGSGAVWQCALVLCGSYMAVPAPSALCPCPGFCPCAPGLCELQQVTGALHSVSVRCSLGLWAVR